MASSILNSDDGVISGTSGLKSTGGDDGVLVFQSKGTETARINTDKQIVAAAGTASLPIYSTTGDTNTGIFFPASDTIAFAEGGAEAMRIDSSGNVGIRTTSIGSQLTINGLVSDSVFTDGLRVIRNGTSSQHLTLNYAGGAATFVAVDTQVSTPIIRFSTSTDGSTATERMRIDSSGNVGIGTTSPSSYDSSARNLVVGNASGAVGITISGGSALSSAIHFADGTTGDQSYRGFINYAHDVDAMRFGTSGSERARITSGGNFLVGVTSSSEKVHIKGGNGNQLALDNAGERFSQVTFLNNGSAKAYMWWDNTNTLFNVQSGATGGVYLDEGGTSWTAVSDERQKDIIEPITNAINKVALLRAVIGKYKTDDVNKRRSFLIAQDVQNVLPEAVNTKDSENLGIQYTDVIPLLVAAIKELKAINDAQAQRIETLEAKVSALEANNGA